LCYTEVNVEEGHGFGGDDRRAVYRSGEFRGTLMHSVQRARTTSVQTGFLRQQDLLRNVKRA